MADPGAKLKLTTKQRLFLEYFLGECQFNATAAARKAGYKFPNVEGPNNLVNPSIRARIDELFDEVGATRAISIGMVLQDATRTDADILATSALAPSVPATAAIASGLISARTTARTNLAKIHGLLTDRVNIKHSGRVDHVHRVAQHSALTDQELEQLERIALAAQTREHTVPA